jgi:hypothetical protein
LAQAILINDIRQSLAESSPTVLAAKTAQTLMLFPYRPVVAVDQRILIQVAQKIIMLISVRVGSHLLD